MAQFSPPSRCGNGDRRRIAVSIGWSLSLLVALVPVLQPLFSPDLTCGYDNIFHLYRAIQVDHLWADGVLYSRWAPDMALGYGFPLYLFTSFFPPALTAILHRLGATWPVALNAAFGLGVVSGAYLMTLLARDLFGGQRDGRQILANGAGLVAAVAYAYAPFQIYDVLNRGSLWESLAWAFPPLVLWAVQRYGVHSERRYLLVGVAGLGGMVLSHHLFAFLFAPVFALWVVAQAALRRQWGIVWRGALLGVLGMGATAFHWLPPLVERSFVQTERLLGVWVFDYRYNFLPFDHLVAFPRVADPALLNDWPQKALGFVPLVVGLLPLLGWRRASAEKRLAVALLWACVIGAAFLTQPASLWIWDRMPLLRYVQYPWRFLGPAAFCLALLAGAAAQTLTELGQRLFHRDSAAASESAAATLLVAVCVVASLGWLYPRHCAAPGNLAVGGMIEWERATDTLGTTAGGEYLPIWVEQMPTVSLDEAYRAGKPVDRLRSQDLPEGAVILQADYGVQSASLILRTDTPFRARYLAFYYPGWRVTIDGNAVPIAPEEDTGLLTFVVPQGEHVVGVSFGETPLRTAADVVSGASLVLLTFLMVTHRQPAMAPRAASQPASARSVGILLVAVTFLVAGKLVLVDDLGLLWRRTRLSQNGTLDGVAQVQRWNFGGRALLLGLEPLPSQLPADEEPLLTLYWQALKPGHADWRVGLALVGPDGSRFGAGLRPARWAREPGPLWEWPPDSYARMDYIVDLPAGLSPGTYGVELSLFDRASGVPASVLDGAGNPVGPALQLDPIAVQRPREVPSLEALGMDPGSSLAACGKVGLWGFSLDRASAAPGDLVAVRMVWEAIADPISDLQGSLSLSNAASSQRMEWDVALAAPWWPTSQWSAGDRWTGTTWVRLPGSLETGDYTLELSLGECALATGSLSVEAPVRRYRVPADLVPVDVALGDTVRLAAISAVPTTLSSGSAMTVALAWEALEEMPVSYRVFIHLVGDDGLILAQSDGEPVDWTRPTTGWAVGEVVVDQRVLSVPDGYTGVAELRVGLYDPAGTRLVTASGDDAIVLARVDVQ